jgi:flagellar hook-length control protein FliK
MQTPFKLFEILPAQGMEGSPAFSKIAIKTGPQNGMRGEESAAGFMQLLNALMVCQPDQMQQCLAQLDWVRVDAEGPGEVAPLIDLSNATEENGSMLLEMVHMLLGGNGTMAGEQLQWTDASGQPGPAEAAAIRVDKNLMALTAPEARISNIMQPAADQTAAADLPDPAKAQEPEIRPGLTLQKIAATQTDLPARDAIQPSMASTPLTSAALVKEQAKTASKPVGHGVDTLSVSQENGLKPETPPAPVPEFVRKGLNSRSRSPDGGLQTPKNPVMNPLQADDPVDWPEPNKQNLPSMERELTATAKQGFSVEEQAVHVHKDQTSVPQAFIRAVTGRVDRSETVAVKNAQSPTIPRDAQSDIIQQIVRNMNFRTDGSHSRVQIRLKPEFLGDIRMQIITENHQVMVRMSADSHAVKEIIEHNMHQLKHELQQHGLQIEKFEVLVGQEGNEGKNSWQQSAFQQARQRKSYRSARSDESRRQAESRPGDIVTGSDGSGTRGQSQPSEIDYFA